MVFTPLRFSESKDLGGRRCEQGCDFIPCLAGGVGLEFVGDGLVELRS